MSFRGSFISFELTETLHLCAWTSMRFDYKLLWKSAIFFLPLSFYTESRVWLWDFSTRLSIAKVRLSRFQSIGL